MDSKKSTGGFIQEQLEKLTVTTDFDNQEFKIIAPKVTKVDYEYDENDRIVKSYSDVYGTNIMTSFEYDENGNATKITTVVNGNTNETFATTKEYDDQNRLIKSEGPEGLETFEYSDTEVVRNLRDYTQECDIVEKYTPKGDLLYRSRTPAVKGSIDQEMSVVIDGSFRTSIFKQDIQDNGELSIVHKEVINIDTNKIVSMTDLKPTESGPVEMRVDFEYDEEGNIKSTSLYQNDVLQKKEETNIVKENDVTIVEYNGMITRTYTKDGFSVNENSYRDAKTGAILEESIVANSEQDHILIEKNIVIPPQAKTNIRIAAENFSIILVDGQIVDVDITMDGKCYEYGTDVHGSGVAYAAVTPIGEKDMVKESTKIEYSKNMMGGDSITDYISNKVFEFIDRNERIKDGLKIMEVDYNALKKE